MTRVRILSTALLLGWLGLLVWIAYQWWNPAKLPVIALPGSEDVIMMPLGSERIATLVADLQNYDNLIERPLFYPTRRPPTSGVERLPEPEPEPTPVADEALSLVGIIMMPEGMRALIREDDSRRVSRLQIGDSVARWRLEAISAEHVRLTRGDRQRVLPLMRNLRQPTLERTPGFEPIEEVADDDAQAPAANG